MTKKMILPILFTGLSSLFASSDTTRESFEYKNIKTLKVKSTALDIEVISDRRKGVEVELIDISDRVDITLEQKGNTLVLKSKIKKLFSFMDFSKNRVVFHVPRNIELDIEGTAGDIEVSGIKSDYNQISSTAGDVEINDSVGEFIINTTAGTQKINNFEGIIECSSSAGDIKGQRITISGNSSFSSTAGSINIDFENSKNEIDFNITSTIGDVRVKDSIGHGDGDAKFIVWGESTIGDQTYR